MTVEDRVIRPQQTVCLIATLKRRRKTKELITLHFKTNGYISLSTARGLRRQTVSPLNVVCALCRSL